MSITEDRIAEIEEAIVRVDAVLNNLVSKTQHQQISLVTQQEIDAIKLRLDSLESQITVLQNNS